MSFSEPLFSDRDLPVVEAILREAAEAEILPRFRNLGEGSIRHKTSAQDLVTDADEAAERRIALALERAFPGAAIVGEEATGRDPSLLGRLADADLAFLVDPVDGTKNFASGLTLFGVMAAVVSRGEVVAGLIHDPIGGDTAMALRGGGAWIRRADGHDAPLRVARAPTTLMEASASVSWHYLPEPARSQVAANLARIGVAICYRCSAHEYCLVAAGHYDFLFHSKLMPWDHAAGWLLHREAGGYSARFDGTPYRPTQLDGGLICASDEGSWHTFRDALLGPLRPA